MSEFEIQRLPTTYEQRMIEDEIATVRHHYARILSDALSTSVPNCIVMPDGSLKNEWGPRDQAIIDRCRAAVEYAVSAILDRHRIGRPA